MQLALLDGLPLFIPPIDTHVVKAEVPRLSRQCQQILDRLREGPVSNTELCVLSRKYTSRVSDLRAAGYDVRVIERDFKTGFVLYGLARGGV